MTSVQNLIAPRLGKFLQDRGLLCLAIGLLIVISGLFEPKILTGANLRNILIQSSYVVILASAQSIVIMTRGFDLSLGVSVSLVSVTSAMAMVSFSGSPAVAIAAGATVGLIAALAVGLFNGILISFFRLNPFVVTLSSMYIVLTLSTTISGGFPVAPLPSELGWFANGVILGIPIPVLVAACSVILLQFILSTTVFGRSVYLIGTNQTAAEVAGIRVKFHLTSAYLLCSAFIAIGAFLLTARTGSGEPNLGGDLTLLTIAGAVLGGVSLRGGAGDVSAPILGAILVTALSNVLNLLTIDGFLQDVVIGIVIIAALSIDRMRDRTKGD